MDIYQFTKITNLFKMETCPNFEVDLYSDNSSWLTWQPANDFNISAL